MINSIKNGDQRLPRVTQVSIAGTSSTEQPPLKDKSMWSDQDKRIQKIDRLARSLLIQGLSNDIYSIIDNKETAKDLWDALARHMLGFENVINDLKKCGYSKDNCELNFKFLNNLQLEWKQYPTMMRHNKNLMEINIDALYNILKQNQGDVNDAMGSKKKTVVSTNKKQEFVKTDNKKVEKKDDEKNRDMSRVKCYNCKKEGHFAKDCKKVKVKDYEYYKTKMLLAKKDKDEQVLLAEDQARMESSSDSDQEINANMVFMAQIEKVLFDSEASSSSPDEKISEVLSRMKLQFLNRKIKMKMIVLLLKKCDKVENSKVIVPGMFKLNLDTFSSVRRPKNSGVIWKKKWSSNTSNVDLSAVILSNLSKNVKRYSRKDLLSCNNSHLGETSSASVCNDAMNVSCNHRMCDLLDESIDSGFTRFNIIITGLKALDEGFSRKNYVRKFLRALHLKWRANVTTIQESKDLSSLALDELIDSGCSKHITGNKSLLSTYKVYNGDNVSYGSNLKGKIIGKESYEGICLGYSQTSKAYVVLNKHIMKVEESLNMTFDESPPTKLLPLVDDDVGEKEAVKNNNEEDESIEVDEVVNIKESKNHPLE
nr:zf-CCHC domain-containing protein/UBN2 domain-containing protein [Tanacetum cinerariifolium]